MKIYTASICDKTVLLRESIILGVDFLFLKQYNFNSLFKEKVTPFSLSILKSYKFSFLACFFGKFFMNFICKINKYTTRIKDV